MKQQMHRIEYPYSNFALKAINFSRARLNQQPDWTMPKHFLPGIQT